MERHIECHPVEILMAIDRWIDCGRGASVENSHSVDVSGWLVGWWMDLLR